MKISQIDLNIQLKTNKNRKHNCNAQNTKNNYEFSPQMYNSYQVPFLAKGVSVYIFFDDGKYQRYDSMPKAGEELGISRSAIQRHLGKTDSHTDYLAIKTEEIESIDENGNVVLDTNKIKEYSTKAQANVIYGINKDGSYKRFKRIEQAAQELNIPQALISMIIARKGKNFVADYTFVKGSEVETLDENNNFSLDVKKLRNILIDRNKFAIYVVTPDGTYEKYESQMQLAQTKFYTKNYIWCLANNYPITKNYPFFIVKASQIEYADKNNKVRINFNKLKKILKSMGASDSTIKKLKAAKTKHDEQSFQTKTPANKRRYYDDIIYAYGKNGTYYEFNGIASATKELNMSEKEIINCIKQSKQSKNGFVFTTDSDK